jgi:hypothetical protein
MLRRSTSREIELRRGDRARAVRALGPFVKKTPLENCLRFQKAHLGLVVRDGLVRLVARNDVVAEHRLFACRTSSDFDCSYPPTYAWAAWLPVERVILISWRESTAEHNEPSQRIDLWRVPARK